MVSFVAITRQPAAYREAFADEPSSPSGRSSRVQQDLMEKQMMKMAQEGGGGGGEGNARLKKGHDQEDWRDTFERGAATVAAATAGAAAAVSAASCCSASTLHLRVA